MKKIFSFSNDEKYYYIKENSNCLKISKQTMQIEGKSLYESFFKDLDLSSKLEYEFINDDSEEKNYKLVIERMKDILKSIIDEINIEFKYENRE